MPCHSLLAPSLNKKQEHRHVIDCRAVVRDDHPAVPSRVAVLCNEAGRYVRYRTERFAAWAQRVIRMGPCLIRTIAEHSCLLEDCTAVGGFMGVTDGSMLRTGRMITITVQARGKQMPVVCLPNRDGRSADVSRSRVLRHAAVVVELLSMYRCMVAALLAHIEDDLTRGGVTEPREWAETARAVRAEFDRIGAMHVVEFVSSLPEHRARLTSLRELHRQLTRLPERTVSAL